jgi:adenylosuccinate lyase
VRAQVQAALEDVPLWHERDISHSSVERVILPDATTLCDSMLARMTAILDGLLVYPERMLRNMEITNGLIYSQAVLLALTRTGMVREKAYEIIRRNAMRTWAGEGSLKELLAADDELTAALPPDDLNGCFDPAAFLDHVDLIFDRVFGDS